MYTEYGRISWYANDTSIKPFQKKKNEGQGEKRRRVGEDGEEEEEKDQGRILKVYVEEELNLSYAILK